MLWCVETQCTPPKWPTTPLSLWPPLLCLIWIYNEVLVWKRGRKWHFLNFSVQGKQTEDSFISCMHLLSSDHTGWIVQRATKHLPMPGTWPEPQDDAVQKHILRFLPLSASADCDCSQSLKTCQEIVAKHEACWSYPLVEKINSVLVGETSSWMRSGRQVFSGHVFFFFPPSAHIQGGISVCL